MYTLDVFAAVALTPPHHHHRYVTACFPCLIYLRTPVNRTRVCLEGAGCAWCGVSFLSRDEGEDRERDVLF